MTLDAGASGALLDSAVSTHPGIRERYLARLRETFPKPLDTIYLVHSLNEATELALRLARTHRSGKDVIVHDDTDYGMTTTLASMSPARRKFWVHAVPRGDASAVARAAQAIHGTGRGLCGFFAEGVFEAGYLQAAYDAVRAAGGLNVSIEEQTGMGRVGEAFWEFARHGVAPDIVVAGESLGDGFPMAAVVTRAELAAPFDTGTGGGAAACAAGMTVLDRLRSPTWAPDFSGFTVRGAALCWEIDVTDAPKVAEKLRLRGVGIHARGNTLLFRPPLTFTPDEGKRFVEALRAACST